MLPDYGKYMRELCRVRCGQSEKSGIKPLRLDLQGLAVEQGLLGQ
jgi:hypothetical protein